MVGGPDACYSRWKASKAATFLKGSKVLEELSAIRAGQIPRLKRQNVSLSFIESS